MCYALTSCRRTGAGALALRAKPTASTQNAVSFQIFADYLLRPNLLLSKNK